MNGDKSGQKSGDLLATPVKRLPNTAKWALEDSLTAADEGTELIEQAIEMVDNPHSLRLLHKAYANFTKIKLALSNVRTEKGE
jgi:hypothetical protein